jgi:hypothetical protein
MYQVLKDFAGPGATVIASFVAVIITGYFARQQVHMTEEKLRYDLFDRRLKIFSSIFDFYEAMLDWQATPEQITTWNRFFRAYQESRFLFRKESG